MFHHYSNVQCFAIAICQFTRKCHQIYRKNRPLELMMKYKKTGSTMLAFSFGSLFSNSDDHYNSNYEFMAESITPKDELLSLAQNGSMRHQFELFVMQVQREFCQALESMETKYTDEIDETKVKRFQSDRWLRQEGGGGITCVLQDGAVFEKAGVNISVVHGQLPPQAAAQMRSRGKHLSLTEPLKFFATGVSSVIHPRNPNIPTLHFNFRYFEIESNEDRKSDHWWFGGGTDMTPYILDEQDAKHFHRHLKQACDKHDRNYYGRFKKWCDDYFYIKHRDERRGIGGLFFDDIDYPDQKRAFAFIKDCARSLVPSYIPIIDRNATKPYSLNDRQWQLIRRGRYVEFNLIYDRGTKFGLMTPGARYESILMSLPLAARWEYQHNVAENSKESALMKVLKNPREWV
ncbi:coproporphyrinogen-III oxidase-like protein [Euroglyphus maynei]|uniref:coproporphyrinogen oxidase n=1 Tax=Euroglyphus maynei TaxID=6958 RepID=A0A1Y3AW79_EURMA|nr:coproporphyrinogen-III oxidase-like protein [Euroglyphus maynei]